MIQYPVTKRTLDVLALVFLGALTVIFASRFVNFSIPPFEDAAMLMRYADHFAHGNGIVWNIGEHPVDGATDFLFMVVVAFVSHTGLRIETAVRLVTLFSHFATVALIYLGMRKVQHSGIFPACLSATYFAVGPGLFLSAAYFGTPFYALAMVVAWLLAQRLINSQGRSENVSLFFSAACLTVGLARPEGVLVCLFMLAAVGILIPSREFRRLTVVFGAVFVAVGGAYFVWRWNYFGYPLPNPFYKKGGGHLYYSGLKSSVLHSGVLLLPYIPVYVLAVYRRSTRRMGIAFLIPIVGSVAMWILVSNEMNFGGRVQNPVLAIGALSWYPLVRTLKDGWRLPEFASLSRMYKLTTILVMTSLLAAVFILQLAMSSRATYGKDGRYDLAVMLSGYAGRGYTIATTEAGLLPFYSGWRAIDTWGLNDQWIAHHGLITENYIRRERPDIIVLHEKPAPVQLSMLEGSDSLRDRLWSRQVLVLKDYAERNNFTLAAAVWRVPGRHAPLLRTLRPSRAR